MATVETSSPIYAGFGGMGDGFGCGGMGGWGFLILAMLLMGGGFGWGGWGNNGFANAIGYENLATSNEIQRGFSDQNITANQRETLSTINDASARGVAATNQVYHDVVANLGDKYSELARDIAGVNAGVAQAIANQCQLNGDLKLQISETGNGINANVAQTRFDGALNTAGINANIAQNRYDAAMNTAAINANTSAQTQKILDKLNESEKNALQNRVNQLELAQAMAGVVKYPMNMAYNAGTSPFCNCNSGCGCGYPLYS